MATLPQTKTVTYEEWLTMPEVEDAIEEVVNGEIRIIPPPDVRHGDILDQLFFLIRSQVNPREIEVRVSVFGLIIRTHPLTSRVPDLAMFLVKTMVEKDGYINSAPQLAVEVLSPANTRRERADKLADYASIGIPELWVIAPQGETVEVLYLQDGQYIRAHFLGSGDILKPKLFPNVQVNIAEIWPD